MRVALAVAMILTCNTQVVIILRTFSPNPVSLTPILRIL